MNLPIDATYVWSFFTPILLALLAGGALVLDMIFWRQKPRSTGVFVFIGLILVLFGQFMLHSTRLLNEHDAVIAFQGEYLLDLFSAIFNYLFLIAAAVSVVLSFSHFDGHEGERGEFYVLILISTIGMSMMAAAHDLLIFFIGLEIMSIAIYVMVGIQRKSLKGGEASLKYLLLGAFSSGILLYGMALLYGASGRIDYISLSRDLGYVIADQGPAFLKMSALIGALMVLVGLLFKVAAVPFHMWTPDVYEGAPTPVTAYMATGVKAAAFAAMVRLLLTAWSSLWNEQIFFEVLRAVAILTMIVGNLAAIAQKNVKRMLAYSSIAHAGYLLIAVTSLVAAGQYIKLAEEGDASGLINTSHTAYLSAYGIIYYLLVYAIMNLGAFGLIVALGREKPGAETLDDFAGLGDRRPLLAGLMAVCMLSLAGVPPLAGFTAKFTVFKAAIHARLYFLAIIGVLNSVLAAFYYLRVLVVMYMEKEKSPAAAAPRFSGAVFVTVVMAALLIIMGLFPEKVFAVLDLFTSYGITDTIRPMIR